MRSAVAIALLLALAGCGESERERPRPPVRVEISEPSDLAEVYEDSVEVRGTVVPPDARVLVAGDQADVSGGEFTATVDLEAGANVIDVQAGAPQRPATMTALRVTRILLVEIPPLEGLSPNDAVAALEQLDLVAEIDDTGDLIDDVFFGDEGVCGTQPQQGEQVPPGTTVVVEIQGVCRG